MTKAFTPARLLASIVTLCASMNAAYAQPSGPYPAATVRIIVSYPPGGSSDLTARLLADHLKGEFKQTVVVENRPGAGGMIGAAYVAKAKPDGYTLLLGASNFSTARATIKNLPIVPYRDLEPVAQLAESPNVILVNGALPAKTMQDFLAHAKANAGKLNYGYFSTSGKLMFAQFAKASGLDMTPVAYAGEGLMISAIASGEVQFGIGTSIGIQERVSRGQIRVLAVASDKRLASMPDVPTTGEAGVGGFRRVVWFGIFAPAGVSAQVRDRLAEGIAGFARQKQAVEKLGAIGFAMKVTSPADFKKFVLAEEQEGLEIAKAVGIRPE